MTRGGGGAGHLSQSSLCQIPTLTLMERLLSISSTMTQSWIGLLLAHSRERDLEAQRGTRLCIPTAHPLPFPF